MSYPKPTNATNSDYPNAIGAAIDALNRRLKGNLLDNGAFQIWQRGTSIAVTSSGNFSADRWGFARGAGATGATVTRQTGVSARYACRVQRDSGNASAQAVVLLQSVETENSIPAAGRTVTLSFKARCGANFSPTSSLFSVTLLSGTGTDQSLLSAAFTGSASPISQTATASTSQATYQYTATVPAGTTELGVQFSFTPTGTAGANDWIEFEEVQLVIGDYAGNYPYRAIAEELAICRRYFQTRAFRVPATTAVSEPIWMRGVPTITGGGSGYTSTGTTADTIVHFQTTGGVQTLLLTADI